MATGFDKYNRLCRALEMGDWTKAKEFLDENEDGYTAELNSSGQRSLHIAIGNSKDTKVLTELLTEMKKKQKQLQGLVDELQQNALHYAAVLGNTKAAKLLVREHPELLCDVDKDDYLPIHKAICNSHEATFKYLLRAYSREGIDRLFQGDKGVWLLCEIIVAGFLDIAYYLLKLYPELATKDHPDVMPPLWCIANKREVYLSAKQYNFYERFFYSLFDKYNPLCRALQKGDWEKARKFLNLDKAVHLANENSLHERNQTPDIENQQTNRANPVTKCTKSNVNDGIERIIDKLREVPLQFLRIKHLKKDKVDHNIAIMILKLICEKVDELSSNHEKHYKEAYFTAVKNDTPEVVEQIVKTFPQSILMADSNGYRLSQLSILNRSEKIYHFFVHEVTQNKHLHIVTIDKNGNNLLHLAGKLAPAHKLDIVTGAALQMQMELQWFKEVKKLMRPKDKEGMNKKKKTPDMVFRKKHADLRKEGEAWMKKVANSYTITVALIITIIFAASITVPGGIKEKNGIPTLKANRSFTLFLVSDAISLFTSTTSLLFFQSILTARYAEEDFLYRLPIRLMCGLVTLFLSVTTMLFAFGATLYIMSGQDNLIFLIVIATFVPIAVFVVLQLPLLRDLIYSTFGHGIFQK